VVVLDRDLPVMHGDTVCRRLADSGEARILMLTASSAVEDRVAGLDLGADDYLGKPFAFAELVARVKALSRRAATARPPILRSGDIVLDSARRTAERAGRLLQLTPKEFGVLQQLLAADGHVVSAEALLEKVWDEHADPFTNAVRITVATLRRKLGEPQVIHTVTGAGYRIGP
jgi:DNA-binding response OmpR family regulator